MKSQIDEGVDPVELIRRLNENDVKYLLIGAMALSMHDVPVGSMDWDFWIHREDKKKTYDVFSEFGLTGNHNHADAVPMEIFTNDEGFKVDVFFVKDFKNKKKGMTVAFDDVYSRSVVREDPKGGFFVRIPSLEDLLLMLRVLDEPRYQHLKRMEYIDEILKKERKND